MELNVVNQGRQPSIEQLVRAIKHADALLHDAACDMKLLGGATVYTNTVRPGVYMTNVATDLRIPEAMNAKQVVDEVIAYFDERKLKCWCMQCGEMDWPGELAEVLEQRGYQANGRRLFYLEAYRQPGDLNNDLQIVPGRAVYKQLGAFYFEGSKQRHSVSDEVAGQLRDTKIDWLDDPRVEVMVGRLNGEIAGVVGLVSLGQVGVINDVYTKVCYEQRQVATTLLSCVIEQCKRAQFEHVVLETFEGSDVGGFYERLGFKDVCRFVHYQLPDEGDVS